MNVRSGIKKTLIIFLFLGVISSSLYRIDATQQIENKGRLSGVLKMPEQGSDFEWMIKVYDEASYIEDDPDTKTHEEENKALYETVGQYDGSYEIEGIDEGTYRLEYSLKKGDLDQDRYEVLKTPKDKDYKVLAAKDQEYFAYIKSVEISAGEETVIDVEVVERGQETESETETDSETTVGTESETETETETESESMSEVGTETETEAETESKTEVETETETESETETETESEHLSEVESESAEETESEWAAETNQETGAEDEYEGFPTIDELKLLSDDIAAATRGRDAKSFKSSMARLISGTDWTFDVYYVNQNNNYYVEKNADFNLKYQVEFHNSKDLEVNQVQIRIPKVLLTYRNGKVIVPTEIAVPRGTVEDPVQIETSPFNYYEDGDDLVFFNYELISSGSNAAFQVLYKGLEALEIIDQTRWSNEPEITVGSETKKSKPLTGYVDTSVQLNSVTKTAHNDAGYQYTPGLYSADQIKRYASNIDSKFINNFDNYKFVVWKIKYEVTATQKWNLYLKDTTKTASGTAGEIVGFSSSGTLISSGSFNGMTQIKTEGGSRHSGELYVVTAYPKNALSAGQRVYNTVEVKAEPIDKKDSVISKSSSASWSYVNYNWVYSGNTIGVEKRAAGQKHSYNPSWLEVYRAARKEGVDQGDFSYYTTSICYGYGFTHYTSGTSIGQQKPGKSYTVTTVDDFLYAYSSDAPSNPAVLDDSDYYFSKVQVRQSDQGIDIWEDRVSSSYLKSAGTLEIYAMFAGSSQWQHVKSIPWNTSGNLSYTFSEEELARQPWRIKAEHNTVNYQTVCNIDVDVRIRHNSVKLGNMVDANKNLEEITVENISGVAGQEFTNSTAGSYFHDTNQGSNYQQKNLANLTRALYGMLIQRDSAFHHAQKLIKHAESFKSAETLNDVVNNRVQVRYQLAAFDGYEVGSQDQSATLKRGGLQTPGRNEVVFYDLLPYGVTFDPSASIIAGRMTSYSKGAEKHPEAWDTSQVSAYVASGTDIIPNFNGTGRTLIGIHVYYEGADSSFYTNQMWMEGWGVSFGAYYNWKDMNLVGKEPNICAFMPAPGDNRELLGEAQQIYSDNGSSYPDEMQEIYKYFGADIDGDKNTSERTVLYSNAMINEEVTVSGVSNITKLVRADADRFAPYQKEAEVVYEKGYTYDLNVVNVLGTLKDIVVFDRLERAAIDRQEEEPDRFDTDSWCGTYAGVSVKSLEALGIKPVVYYNADRAAVLPTDDAHPTTVLKEALGWYTETRWVALGKPLSDVKAVAVDLSKKTDNSNFELADGESVSFQIHMTAPSTEQVADAVYAYNNPSYYSHNTQTNTKATVEGNSVRVKLNTEGSLEVEKQFKGEVPEGVKDEKFRFTIYKGEINQIPVAFKEYQLFSKDEEGEWQLVKGTYATDGEGAFYLCAGQKAVFSDVKELADVQIKEQENPFWEQEEEQNKQADRAVFTFRNAYRPVLFTRKTVRSAPAEVNTSECEFVYQILVDGKPLKNAEYWYVDSVRLNGGTANKVASLGNNGVGMTDEEGKFPIRPGEIIALFPGKANCQYEIIEVEGNKAEDDWICLEPSVGGKLPWQGAEGVITNIYALKSLYLTKEITHQAASECDQEFTFKVTDEAGNAVVGNRYTILEDGTSKGGGVLGIDGTFGCYCAGKVIRIDGLRANQTYTIEEIESGTLYEAQDGGIVKIKMPLYGSKEEAVIVNDYIKRSLSVSKKVVYDAKDSDEVSSALNQVFYMFVLKNGEALKEVDYEVYDKSGNYIETKTTNDKGRVELYHDQTAVFKEVATKWDTYKVTEKDNGAGIFRQVYPANEEGHEGLLSEDINALFINSSVSNTLFLSKEYSGEDETGADYAAQMKTNPATRKNAAVSLTLKTIDSAGNSTIWPAADTTVRILDQLDGENSRDVVWKAGQPLTVQPWELVMISGIDESTSYVLSEAGEDQHRVFSLGNGKWIEIGQKEPAGDQGISGTVKEDPVAILYNGIKGVEFQSEIRKKMKAGSGKIPEGAKLVLRVEVYDGKVWSPASGIQYATFDANGLTSPGTLMTGADGLITLMKTANGYPIVRFVDQGVRVQTNTSKQTGDLRVVEVAEKSDLDWGFLSSYQEISETQGVFVNANWKSPVQIEKKMENPTDSDFTMVLKQVIETSTSPVTDKEQILKSEPRGNIAYTIYDSETNKPIGSGVTNAYGELTIKAGQYVQLDLPDETLWTVSEKVGLPYILKDLMGTPEDQMTKLDDNLMLIYQTSTVEEITLTAEMVASGVIDAQTGETVVLNTGDVEIPSRIIWEDKEYIVVGIGDQAFYQNKDITSVSMPDGIRKIGDRVFMGCSGLTGELRLPDDLEEIGEDAFYGLSYTGNLNIPDGVKKIGAGAFRYSKFNGTLNLSEGLVELGAAAFTACTGLTGDIYIPSGVTIINANVFEGCKGFDGELIIAGPVTEIGNSAFASCEQLSGNLVLEAPLQKIGNSAFSYSGFKGSLGDLILPDTLTEMEESAFYFSGFTGVLKLPANLKIIPYSAFGNVPFTGNLEIPSGVEEIGELAFAYAGFDGKLVIEEGVRDINGGAFYHCKNLTGDIIIPASVESMGYSASDAHGVFTGCEGFDGNVIILPGNLTVITYPSFLNCSSIKEVHIPANVTTIESPMAWGSIVFGAYAFEGMTSLEKIRIYKPADSITGKPWGAPASTVIQWGS